jgi:histone-lysine N-methyltransferase SETMAR
MKNVFGDEAPSLEMVSKWYRSFQTGHFSVQDDPREGRPRGSTDESNVDAVKAALEEDPRMTVEKLQEGLRIDATSIWRILHDHLEYSKKSARWVPRLLSEEQKLARVRFSLQFLKDFKNGTSANFRNIVTGDEAWFYNFDPLTKEQSKVWSEKGAAPPVKAKRERSVGKTMFAVFFSRQGVVASVPLEEGKTVTSQWYTEICLPVVFKNLLKGRPATDLRRHFMHHDNASAHTAKNTIHFIGESGINLIDAPPYSPDLAPCDIWLFSKVKEPIRGKRFDTREDPIFAVNQQLNKLENRDFEDCFERWLYGVSI